MACGDILYWGGGGWPSGRCGGRGNAPGDGSGNAGENGLSNDSDDGGGDDSVSCDVSIVEIREMSPLALGNDDDGDDSSRNIRPPERRNWICNAVRF